MADHNRPSMNEAEKLHAKGQVARKLYEAWTDGESKYVAWWLLEMSSIARWMRAAEMAMRHGRPKMSDHAKGLLARRLFDAWVGDDKFVEWYELQPVTVERWFRAAQAAGSK